MLMRCARCRGRLLHERSAFAILMTRGDDLQVEHDVVKAEALKQGNVVMHMHGDPECGREVSGFRRALSDSLCVSAEAVSAFLNKL